MFLSRFRVNGSSMEPAFKEGDYVLAFSYFFRTPKVGDVVILKKENTLLIKRIHQVENEKIIVTGDNSRSKFTVNKKDILGKVFLKI